MRKLSLKVSLHLVSIFCIGRTLNKPGFNGWYGYFFPIFHSKVGIESNTFSGFKFIERTQNFIRTISGLPEVKTTTTLPSLVVFNHTQKLLDPATSKCATIM
jgi:hypothetical protein